MKHLLVSIAITAAFAIHSVVALASGSQGSVFYVVDFGAVCNGQTDDTVAIRAAIHAAQPGGTIMLPARACNISDTLTLGDDSGQQATTFLSIKGSNPITSKLNWVGASGGTALALVRNKYFVLENFGILSFSSRGSSTGIAFSGYGTGGTETLSGTLRNVMVQGFHIDVAAGGGGVATSEMLYQSVSFLDADVCWLSNDLNTLNHIFTLLQLGNCGVGLQQQVGNVAVYGGSTYGDGVDFSLAGDNATIQDVRAELNAGSTFIFVNNLKSFRASGNMTTGDSGSTTLSLDLRVAERATVESNLFLSRIRLLSYVNPGDLLLVNNSVNGDTTRPVFIDPQWGGESYLRSLGNVNNGGNSWTHTRYADFIGIVAPWIN